MLITEITDKVTQKNCTFDLATELIENLNAQSKIAIKLDKLLNKNWGNVGISKEKKKVLRKGLASYINVTKPNTKCRINYLKQIKQT